MQKDIALLPSLHSHGVFLLSLAVRCPRWLVWTTVRLLKLTLGPEPGSHPAPRNASLHARFSAAACCVHAASLFRCTVYSCRLRGGSSDLALTWPRTSRTSSLCLPLWCSFLVYQRIKSSHVRPGLRRLEKAGNPSLICLHPANHSKARTYRTPRRGGGGEGRRTLPQKSKSPVRRGHTKLTRGG